MMLALDGILDVEGVRLLGCWVCELNTTCRILPGSFVNVKGKSRSMAGSLGVRSWLQRIFGAAGAMKLED